MILEVISILKGTARAITSTKCVSRLRAGRTKKGNKMNDSS